MNVALGYQFEFLAGVWHDDRMQMNTYRVSISMLTTSEQPEYHNTSLERIKYFMHHVVHGSVFVADKDVSAADRLVRAGVNVMLLPEQPFDQIVGIMLACKLNAICEDHMLITDLDIQSDLGDRVIYYHSHEDPIGPLSTDGWWHDPDINKCLWTPAQEITGNVVTIRKSVSWKDLDLNWNSDQDSDPDNTVVFARFDNDEKK